MITGIAHTCFTVSNLEQSIQFYRDGLGFEVIGSFEDHDGFDGVMLGHPDLDYHLEFTHKRGETVGRAPTEENLLVCFREYLSISRLEAVVCDCWSVIDVGSEVLQVRCPGNACVQGLQNVPSHC